MPPRGGSNVAICGLLFSGTTPTEEFSWLEKSNFSSKERWKYYANSHEIVLSSFNHQFPESNFFYKQSYLLPGNMWHIFKPQYYCIYEDKHEHIIVQDPA